MAEAEPTVLVARALCAECGGPLPIEPPRRGPKRRTCSGLCRRRRAGLLRRRPAAEPKQAPSPTPCRQCGALKPARLSFCCAECQWASMRGVVRRPSLVCNGCGGQFLRRRRAAKDAQIYCSRTCANKARPKASAKTQKTAPLPKPCVVCATPFVGRLLCSAVCRQQHKAQKQREHYSRTTIHPPKTCRQCGGTFAPSHGLQVMCSSRCARKNERVRYGNKHRSRARRHGVAYECVNRVKVFERDGWRCQVCGRRTPKRLQGTICDTAPELDHRVPMAMGGAHTYENCQLACRRCNIAKGGNRVLGQLPLFVKL